MVVQNLSLYFKFISRRYTRQFYFLSSYLSYIRLLLTSSRYEEANQRQTKIYGRSFIFFHLRAESTPTHSCNNVVVNDFNLKIINYCIKKKSLVTNQTTTINRHNVISEIII